MKNRKKWKDLFIGEANIKMMFSLFMCLACILFAFFVRLYEKNEYIETGAFSNNGRNEDRSVTISDLAKKTEKLIEENDSLSWLFPRNEK